MKLYYIVKGPRSLLVYADTPSRAIEQLGSTVTKDCKVREVRENLLFDILTETNSHGHRLLGTDYNTNATITRILDGVRYTRTGRWLSDGTWACYCGRLDGGEVVRQEVLRGACARCQTYRPAPPLDSQEANDVLRTLAAPLELRCSLFDEEAWTHASDPKVMLQLLTHLLHPDQTRVEAALLVIGERLSPEGRADLIRAIAPKLRVSK